MIDWLKTYSSFVTWFLIFVGWMLTIVIYKKQRARNTTEKRKSTYNEMVKDFRDRLEELQQNAFNYWCSENESDDFYKMQVLTRSMKELTSISNDLCKIEGPDYPSQLFIALRQSVTSDKYSEERPIPITSSRVTAINDAFDKLRNIYKRNIS
jgi:regulatory protein YycI of two-component signal transduction system YycFG